jgi:enoyl-CoA hydratase
MSAKVSHRLLAGRPASFAADMVVEYRLARRVVMRPDFREGVRAVIVEKDNRPLWSPARLDDVTEAMLDEIFAPLPPGGEWTPLPGLGG